MDKTTMYRHIFDAFSSLSDAQEHIPQLMVMANERVNHAKAHLGAIIEADREGYVEAMRLRPLACPLTEIQVHNLRHIREWLERRGYRLEKSDGL